MLMGWHVKISFNERVKKWQLRDVGECNKYSLGKHKDNKVINLEQLLCSHCHNIFSFYVDRAICAVNGMTNTCSADDLPTLFERK